LKPVAVEALGAWAEVFLQKKKKDLQYWIEGLFWIVVCWLFTSDLFYYLVLN
jgi:hypothetical protein